MRNPKSKNRGSKLRTLQSSAFSLEDALPCTSEIYDRGIKGGVFLRGHIRSISILENLGEHHGNFILIGHLESRIETKQSCQGHVLLGDD